MCLGCDCSFTHKSYTNPTSRGEIWGYMPLVIGLLFQNLCSRPLLLKVWPAASRSLSSYLKMLNLRPYLSPIWPASSFQQNSRQFLCLLGKYLGSLCHTASLPRKDFCRVIFFIGNDLAQTRWDIKGSHFHHQQRDGLIALGGGPFGSTSEFRVAACADTGNSWLSWAELENWCATIVQK